MKITKTQLTQIIKEEMARLLKENFYDDMENFVAWAQEHGATDPGSAENLLGAWCKDNPEADCEQIRDMLHDEWYEYA